MFYLALSHVGVYSFGNQIASLINVLLVEPVTKALWPMIFQRESDYEGQKIFINKLSLYFYMSAMLAFLGLVVFAKDILMQIAKNPEFWESATLIPIMGFSYVLVGMGRFFDWGLVMAKGGYQISINTIIGATINIGLNILMIPQFGIMGAAYATLISIISLNIMRLYYSNKLYGIKFDILRMFYVTVVSGVIYFLAINVRFDESIAIALAIKGLLILLFPVAIWLSPIPYQDDKEYIRAIWGGVKKEGFKSTFGKLKVGTYRSCS